MTTLSGKTAALLGACLLAAAGGSARAAADAQGKDKDAVTMQDPKARDDMDMQRANGAKGGKAMSGKRMGKGMKKDPAAAASDGPAREETKR